jgi:hypothetical protein
MAERRGIARTGDQELGPGIYGDRRQEIVSIGSDMNEGILRQQLDACLVDEPGDREMQMKAWQQLADPLPVWKRAASSE